MASAGADCSDSGDGAVNSLRSSVRRQWLRGKQLAANDRYYTVVTYSHTERVSHGLSGSFKRLNKIDRRNDSRLIIYDQMIPCSTLLAYLNADHRAAAVPIARHNRTIAARFIDGSNYPGEVLLEAIPRFVEEDLNADR